MWMVSAGRIPIPLVSDVAARSATIDRHYYGELSPEQRAD
jgi:hypothetical protein